MSAALRALADAAAARRDAAFADAALAYKATGARVDSYGDLSGGSREAAATYHAAVRAAWKAHDADPAVIAVAAADDAEAAADAADAAAAEAVYQAQRAEHRARLQAAVDRAVDDAGQFAASSVKVAAARRELAVFDGPNGAGEAFDRATDYMRGTR